MENNLESLKNREQNFKTLQWFGSHLELIDQRKLPTKEEFVRCFSCEDVALAIKEMVVRGAPAIGCAAAFGFVFCVREAICKVDPTEKKIVFSRKDIETIISLVKTKKERLLKSRPTAVNLAWAVSRLEFSFLKNIEKNHEELAHNVEREAIDLLSEDVKVNRLIGSFGNSLIPEKAKILTYCNAGALATAGYGTALGVVRSAHFAGKEIEVFASETRPFLQGARLTTWELLKDEIPVTLISDNMCGYLMNKKEIDVVVVGADRVAANGDVVNKIGTYTLSVLAKENRIPFFVACPLSTIDLSTDRGVDIVIEERCGSEVRGYDSQVWAPNEVRVSNPAFDITPHHNISALITEKGLISPVNSRNLINSI
ncbi:MAG: S-methyl-5-thioribose-1-phosphate isomerase [Betaproteobacteria bacterium TMED82]|nr:MAG: S-methyl-5-thioribose-1-phosphate isomerase [Betaproteobacteria bacterium TMED82]|tara:strand:+ start:4820 stop:5929 length:1110 start_codon:yes stop_codon:yes gene_type:complete